MKKLDYPVLKAIVLIQNYRSFIENTHVNFIIQKQPSCKKCAAPKKAIVKRCEIQGGSQEWL